MIWIKRLIFVSAALLTGVALVLATENYRARRAFEACKASLRARGETLSWRKLMPAPVPDEQNFLATPLLAPCFGYGANSGEQGLTAGETNACARLSRLFSWASRLSAPGDWRSGTVRPLEQWQAQLRSTHSTHQPKIDPELARRYGLPLTQARSSPPADEALAALQRRPAASALEDLQFLLTRNQAQLDELRAASRRPFARLKPLTPDLASGRLMTELATLKSLARPLAISSWTQLVARNAATARADIETMLTLADAAGSEPLLICALVKLAIVDLSLQPIWDGLAEHRWPELELSQLEARLGRINIIGDMQRCLRGERAFALASLGGAANAGAAGPNEPPNPMQNLLRHWPAAFRYRNQINVARAYQALLIDRLDPAGPAVKLASAVRPDPVRQQFMTRSPYNIFTPMLLPAVEKSLEQAAASQASISLARVACALERHRTASGQYPESLGQLVPRFIAALPPDPLTGKPLKYRREAPDRFVLYSVGLNMRDDGGASAIKRSESARRRVPDLDWVWRSGPAASTNQQ